MDDNEKLSQLLREPRFYAALICFVITSAIGHHILVPDTKAFAWAQVVLDLLGGGSLVSLGIWSPKRRQWSNEERVAHGLAPIAPATPPVVMPPPLPPAPDDKNKV